MGQNLGNLEDINNILFSDSKKQINNTYDFYILGEIEMYNYFRLDVAIGNFRCKQFIIKKKDNKMFSQIKVKLKDIKLKMIYYLLHYLHQ